MTEHEELNYVIDRYNMEWCGGYGEPGYNEEPAKGILFADWNCVPDELQEALKAEGYGGEWEDEWVISYETNKAYRNSPDSYSWKPYFVMTDDGEIIGGDEIESGDQLEWYVNEYLLNHPERANVFNIDLEKLGFKKTQGYETGFHPGQNDDPKKVFAEINKAGKPLDVVFDITDVGQFDTHWQIWVRPQTLN